MSISLISFPAQVKAVGNGFSFSRPITVDYTKVPNSTQSNFPVLVSGTYTYLKTTANGGNVTNSSGYDIGFYTNEDCSTGKMNWETETYDASTGVVNYWIKVSSLSHTTDTVFYMCYGNSGITTDQSSATSVWDSNFNAVYHFPNGTTLSKNDSTINAKNGGGNATAATGKIDGAVNFSGTTNVTNSVAPGGTTFTLETWIYPTTELEKGYGSLITQDTTRGLYYDDTYRKINYFEYEDHLSALALTLNTWHHVVAVLTGTSVSFYTNGDFTNSVAFTVVAPTFSHMGFNTGFEAFVGRMDEARISNVARSADWIKTEYNNHSSPSTFYTIGNATEADTTAPTITNVNSDKANGNYKVDEVIDIDVTFSEIVTSTGDVTVTLETGDTDRTCTFTVSSATTGTCNYTVQAGDTTSDLTVSSISGTIKDAALNAMTNFVPTTNLAANKAIVIDTTAPTVSVTAPSESATVSGASVSVTASASDSVGIVGVQFKLDTNTNISTEDTSSPYGVTWDSTAVSEGAHTIIAVARDAAGNYATSTAINVTVDNITIPTLSTSAASSITDTTATLNGSIDALGGENATSRGFAWGTTVVYDATTTESGSHSTGSFTTSLSSLTCGTEYHFRSYAENSAGFGYGADDTLTTSACAVAEETPAPRRSRSGQSRYVQILVPVTDSITNTTNTVTNFVQNVIPDLIKKSPKTESKPEQSLTREEKKWNLLPVNLINNFVFADLPSGLTDLTSKFPELDNVFSNLGIKNMNDLGKLINVNFKLPRFENKKEIPSEILVAKGSAGIISIDSSISLNSEGELIQKIETIVGKPIILSIKPEFPADSITGYLFFKNRGGKTISRFSLNTLLASARLSNTKSVNDSLPTGTNIENELLMHSFEYTDSDGDGIFTAEVTTPMVEGEYEVLTIIRYKDKNKGSKEVRMITVVDPEGYVYEKDNQGREIRLSNVKVSIFKKSNGFDELWDAKTYHQENPQITDNTGKYSFLVPVGNYYITAEAEGYKLYKGNEFNVKEGVSVHFNIEMKKPGGAFAEFFDWKIITIIMFGVLLLINFINDRRLKKRLSIK